MCHRARYDYRVSTPSIYLGREIPRWRPTEWPDILTAVTSGLLDETHRLELKREIPTTRGSNTELARDLASLAPDGGLLVIGIEEDDLGRASAVPGTFLAGLAERIDAVARSRIDPPLLVRSHPPIEDPARAGYGCLLVEVPPSAQAPHMVDNVYYGRGDRAKIKLADQQVREIVEKRHRAQDEIPAKLQDLADHDPVPADRRENGHLYVIIFPAAGPDDALVDLLSGNPGDASGALRAAITAAVAARDGAGSFSPDLTGATSPQRTSDGRTFTSVRDPRQVREDRLIQVTIREDGGIAVVCGRGVTSAASGWASPGPSRRFRVVIPDLALGLAHSALALAGHLADKHSGYQGQWHAGVRLDRLQGALAYDYVQHGDAEDAHPYDREVYERLATSTTTELVDQPAAVAERLVAPLLRGLAIDPKYLPYNKG
jgi:hypothetical protein